MKRYDCAPRCNWFDAFGTILIIVLCLGALGFTGVVIYDSKCVNEVDRHSFTGEITHMEEVAVPKAKDGRNVKVERHIYWISDDDAGMVKADVKNYAMYKVGDIITIDCIRYETAISHTQKIAYEIGDN